ncbi:MAG: RNA polymerase sporulation sigma factor SigK [Defluviitaleaceae bacterium]|nr:RNA polymerase sporulation sigma factor SigK [Defluviitaleaceae bacterium]
MLFGLFYLLQGFFLFGHLTGGNSFPQPLSPQEEQDYLEKYASGCTDAKNILIERNLRLVAHVAKKYSNHAKDSEDLISVGTIGLIKAVSTYRPDKGVRLATYAARCIENEIRMFLRSAKKHSIDTVRLQDIVGVDREGNEVLIEDRIADDDRPIDEQVSLKIQKKRLGEAIKDVLQNREKIVIQLRYGLDNNEELTQIDIAEMLGISRSYV